MIIIAAIGLVGRLRGLNMLLVLERWALVLTGVLVLAMLAGFGAFDWRAASSHTLEWPVLPKQDLWTVLTVLGGTLIVVQGFETSRYLGSEFDRELRVWSCRSSQIVSTIIYLLFVAVATLSCTSWAARSRTMDFLSWLERPPVYFPFPW